MEEKESWKTYSCIGYAFVILCVGVPMWWATTTVYRANWPYTEIEALEEPKIAQSILLISQDAHNDHKLGPFLQQSLADTRLFDLDFRSRVRSDQEEDAFLAYNNVEDLDRRLAELHANIDAIVLFEAPPLFFPDNGPILAFGNGKTLFFKQGCSPSNLAKGVKSVLGYDILSNIETAISFPAQDNNPSWTLRRPIASPSLDVLFSLMIPEPDRYKPGWDIENAINNYINPMLNKISDLYDVSIKSQILYLTSLSLKTKSSGDGYFEVNQDDLGLAINVGSQLSSHVSSKQTLNFLTYIPSIKHSPLMIKDSKGSLVKSNAFLVPRWGGALIHNTNDTTLNMEAIMSVFVSQFRSLLGLDFFDTSLVKKCTNQVISPIERNFLLKLGVVENLAVSRMAMQSLSHLLTQISNIVINEDISQKVHFAVTDYNNAVEFAAKGIMEPAFLNSQTSFAFSEKAFFDDTLLALLYFPEDQKYAIYIPLFLPISISFFGSFLPFLKDKFGKKQNK